MSGENPLALTAPAEGRGIEHPTSGPYHSARLRAFKCQCGGPALALLISSHRPLRRFAAGGA